MSREFARAFYHSKAWKTTRDAYMRAGRGLCEPCLAAGKYVQAEIVHHKVHLTPENVDDPEITLNENNLERVCRDCHARAHPEVYGLDEEQPLRVGFDENGNVVRRDVGDQGR